MLQWHEAQQEGDVAEYCTDRVVATNTGQFIEAAALAFPHRGACSVALAITGQNYRWSRSLEAKVCRGCMTLMVIDELDGNVRQAQLSKNRTPRTLPHFGARIRGARSVTVKTSIETSIEHGSINGHHFVSASHEVGAEFFCTKRDKVHAYFSQVVLVDDRKKRRLGKSPLVLLPRETFVLTNAADMTIFQETH
jgi:hypothetical protein